MILFLWQTVGPSFPGCSGISLVSYYSTNQILSCQFLTNRKKVRLCVMHRRQQCLAKDNCLFPMYRDSGKGKTAHKSLILPVDILTEKGYFLVILLSYVI